MNNRIGHTIAKLRNQLSLSQAQLAKKLSVSQSTIGMWESGQRNINNEDLLKLSDLFNVSTDYLLGKSQFKDEAYLNKQLGIKALNDSLTDEQKEEISKFIDYIKNRDKNN